MTTRKVLILSVSAGDGHIHAAEAIHAHSKEYDLKVDATHLDVMDYVPSEFRKVYTDYYFKFVNKAPDLWGNIYDVNNEDRRDFDAKKVLRGIEQLNTVALRKAITHFAPEAIVCTHFLPAEILSRMIRRERLTSPVWVQVTDFDLHRLWLHDHMTGYFAANEEVAFRMQATGVDAKKIRVTGIPVMPAFSQSFNREKCAQNIGLNPAIKTFLLIGGGAGLGDLATVAENLLGLRDDFQLIVLAGKNAKALASLRLLTEHYPKRLVPVRFTPDVAPLMACADVVITKPGGLTTSECLAMGLPMIINAPIPGQEERNADYLLEQGVALKAFDAVTLSYRARYLLENPKHLQQMTEKANQLGKPHAGKHVIANLLGHN